MESATLLRSALGITPENPVEFHELDLDRLSNCMKFNPRFPSSDSSILEWCEDGGRKLDFGEWGQYLADALLSDWSHNYHCHGSLWTSDLDPTDRLCYSVTQLEPEVFLAAYRCLFGEEPKNINYRALEIVGHALFQPPILIQMGRFCQQLSWAELLSRVALVDSSNTRNNQAVCDLVQNWYLEYQE